MSTATDEQLAQVQLDYARLYIHDLVQRAYDAGKSTRLEDGVKPDAEEVTKAIQAVELAAARFVVAQPVTPTKAGSLTAMSGLDTLTDAPDPPPCKCYLCEECVQRSRDAMRGATTSKS